MASWNRISNYEKGRTRCTNGLHVPRLRGIFSNSLKNYSMRILFFLLISTGLSAQCIGDFDKTLLVRDSAGYFKDLTIRYRNNTVATNIEQESSVYQVITREEVCGPKRNARIYFNEGYLYLWFDEQGLKYLHLNNSRDYIWTR